MSLKALKITAKSVQKNQLKSINGLIKKSSNTQKFCIHRNIYACLFSVHNTISLSRQEQVCS